MILEAFSNLNNSMIPFSNLDTAAESPLIH